MEEPIKNNLTADLSYSSGKLTLDLPEIDLIRERGGINIDSHIEVTGTFEKDNFTILALANPNNIGQNFNQLIDFANSFPLTDEGWKRERNKSL